MDVKGIGIENLDRLMLPTPAAAAPERRNYHTLDGLRGIAAVSIVILHTPHFFGGWNLPSSFLSVDLFFVLSGFVLAAVYEPRFQLGMTSAEFLRIRLIRLYPLYILSIALGIPVALLGMRFGGGGLSVPWTPALFLTSLPLSAAMLPTPNIASNVFLYPFCPVLWSILFELFINLVYVTCWRWLRSTKTLISVVALSAVALICYTVRAGKLDVGSLWPTFAGGVLRVTFSFFFGVLIFHVWGRQKRRQSPLALAMVIALPLILFLPEKLIFELPCVLLLFPMMVALSSTHEPGPRVQRAFNVLGVSSYAIYTVHKPLYQLLFAMLKRALPFNPESFAPWIGIVFIALLIWLCRFIDRVYDVPLRRMLSRRKKSVQRPLALGTSA